MTNFSAGRSQRSLAWLTPERAVVLLPILLGLGLASMVLILGFTPLSVLVRDRQTTVDELKIKRDAVPNLRAEQSPSPALRWTLSLVAKMAPMYPSGLCQSFWFTITTTAPQLQGRDRR